MKETAKFENERMVLLEDMTEVKKIIGLEPEVAAKEMKKAEVKWKNFCKWNKVSKFANTFDLLAFFISGVFLIVSVFIEALKSIVVLGLIATVILIVVGFIAEINKEKITSAQIFYFETKDKKFGSVRLWKCSHFGKDAMPGTLNMFCEVEGKEDYLELPFTCVRSEDVDETTLSLVDNVIYLPDDSTEKWKTKQQSIEGKTVHKISATENACIVIFTDGTVMKYSDGVLCLDEVKENENTEL